MGTEAYILCIGGFSEGVKNCLSYDPEFYDDTKPGTSVITHRCQCNTSDQSRQLAEVLGCEVWDFNTHRIDSRKINWIALSLLDTTDWDERKEVGKLNRLLEAKFICIYIPNG